jgi:hypothetical protein
MPWMWTLAFAHHEVRTPTHGYAATCEDAMAAFEKLAAGDDVYAPAMYPTRGR